MLNNIVTISKPGVELVGVLEDGVVLSEALVVPYAVINVFTFVKSCSGKAQS
jgi:hypothetical protein